MWTKLLTAIVAIGVMFLPGLATGAAYTVVLGLALAAVFVAYAVEARQGRFATRPTTTGLALTAAVSATLFLLVTFADERSARIVSGTTIVGAIAWTALRRMRLRQGGPQG